MRKAKGRYSAASRSAATATSINNSDNLLYDTLLHYYIAPVKRFFCYATGSVYNYFIMIYYTVAYYYDVAILWGSSCRPVLIL